MLELLLITNDPVEARLWDEAGVDIVFVDLEIRGKSERQGHLDTVISSHQPSDISAIKPVLNKSRLLVRVNPLHDASKAEVNEVIERGADIIMLPMFHSADDIRHLADMVKGRCEIYPLIETPEALRDIESLSMLENVSGFHFGLNDLHLALKLRFMFEVLLLPEFLQAAEILRRQKKVFGIGGVAKLGTGTLPAEWIIRENFRLGSSRTILSRSFKEQVGKEDMSTEIAAIKAVYARAAEIDLDHNKESLARKIEEIVDEAR